MHHQELKKIENLKIDIGLTNLGIKLLMSNEISMLSLPHFFK